MANHETNLKRQAYLATITLIPLLVLFSFCFISSRALGQNLTPNASSSRPVNQMRAERFYAALKAISLRWKVAFIAEAEPLLSHSSTPSFAIQDKMGLEETVKRVADDYDYSVVTHGSLFVLTKQYTDPGDLPDVTLEECRMALKSASQMIAPFNPRIPLETQAGDPLAAGIFRVLTPQQAGRLQSEGVPVASLRQEQREEVWRIALHFYAERESQEMENTINYLESIVKQDPVFQWQKIAEVSAFGYEVKFGSPQKTVFMPMSNSNRVIVRRDGVRTEIRNATRNGIPVDDIDPTDLPMANRNKWLEPLGHTVSVTLKQVADDINTRNSGNALCKVDAAFAQKRVTAVGLERETPVDVMQALALIYGLRVTRDRDKSLILTLPRYLFAQNISELGPALRSAIPKPLFLALSKRLHYDEQGKENKTQRLLRNDYNAAAGTLKLTATQWLRVLSEPVVSAAKEKHLALSRFDEREKKLFALTLIANAVADAYWLSDRTPPPYISDFDKIVLTGNLRHDEMNRYYLSLFLSYMDPKTGIIQRGVGFINARVPQ